jgi:hypothetical protein
MGVAIPPDFDYRKELLNYNELIIRDVFRLRVENWTKFRFSIQVGTETTRLRGQNVSEESKDAYLSLGKCHYEVICSLGYAYKSFQDTHIENPFICEKAIKEFYFHAGALLDILSRIVFIMNIPESHLARNKKGIYERHLIDRGTLISNKHKIHIDDYLPFLESSLILELINIRNSMAHYWRIPNMNGTMWPRNELKNTKAFAWPYCETDFKKYSDWQSIAHIMKDHFTELEHVQNEIFGLLIRDIPKFEKIIGAIII